MDTPNPINALALLLLPNHVDDIESGNEQPNEKTPLKLTQEDETTPTKNKRYRSTMLIHNKSVREYFREKVWKSINVAGVEKFYQHFNTELLLAIQENDWSRTITALDRAANVDSTCKHSLISACHIAAYYGYDEILEELIKRKANFNKKDNGGRSPLDIAIWTNNTKCVKMLSKEKYSKDTGDTEVEFKYRASLYCLETKNEISKIWSGYPALHLASACLHVECIEILLAAGYSITWKDKDGLTALDVCGKKYYEDYENLTIRDFNKDIEQRFCKILQIFVAHKGSHKIKDSIHYSMQMAKKTPDNIKCDKIKDGNESSVKIIEKIAVSTTPLHFAALLNSGRAIKLLHKEASAFTGCQNKDGNTPLHTAAAYKMQTSFIALTSIFIDCPSKCKGLLDKPNNKKQTPLHLAIASKWIAGVNMFLASGSDFALPGEKNKSVFHMTAETGDVEMLLDIIEKKPICKNFLNSLTDDGETPLYISVARSDIVFMRKLFEVGKMCNKDLDGVGPNGTSVIHKAAEVGDVNVLLELLNSSHRESYFAEASKCKTSPLYVATENNKAECVKILLGKEICEKMKQSSHSNDDSKTLSETTTHPYHIAAHMGYKECIRLYIEHGADISEKIEQDNKDVTKVLDVIMIIMHNPVEYLEDLCSSFIKVNGYHLDDFRCEITLDYSFLMPPTIEKNEIKGQHEASSMRIVKALTNPNSNYDQQILILHPLIESFQYLHWRELKKFFFYILIAYSFFVVSLTATVIMIYQYDILSSSPTITLYKSSCIVFLWITMAVVLLQDLLFLLVKGFDYLKSPAAIIKMSSLGLSLVVSLINHSGKEMWPRYVTAGAILLAWIEIVMLMSRFPKFGYLYQMFETVAFRVVKVMALFGCFLIIGFSLAFWVIFKSVKPFDGPWNSVMKTIVMMTSEFDYTTLNEKGESMEYPSFPQITFILFLVAMPIVVMNLLLALAVSDTKDLITEGRIHRLLEQLEFLSILDMIVYTPHWKFLPECMRSQKKYCMYDKTAQRGVLIIKPVEMKKYFSKHIITGIYQIIKKQKKNNNITTTELDCNKFKINGIQL